MALTSLPGDSAIESLAPLGLASALAYEAVQGAGATGALPMLVQGMPAGAFMVLACIAGIRGALSGSWPLAWLCLAALAAGGFQLALGPGLASLFPALQRWTALAEPVAGAALAMCFVGFVCSLARRNQADFPGIRQAAIGTTALVILNLGTLWLPRAAAQLALLLAAGGCAYFAVLFMKLRGIVAVAGLLSVTSLAALFHLLLRLDGVGLLVPAPSPHDGTLHGSAAAYVATALVNLAILGLWLHHAGDPRPAPQPARAKRRAQENLRLGLEVARQTTALSQALAQAQTQSNQRVQVLSYVAHDLRAPLATILGYVRLLRDSRSPPRREHLDAIARAVAFQMSLIDDVLEYGKAELAPLHLAPASTRLPALLDEIVAGASVLSQSGRNRLVYVPPAFLPAAVEVDGRRLQQVLLNLLSNAAKFTPAGAISLIVAARRESGPPRWRLHFCVKDEGIGIEPARQGAIFDAYVQLEQARGGVGLGLFIAARIVEGMGGELAVSSVAGEGSAFSFEVELPETDGTLVATAPGQRGGAGHEPLADLPANLSVPPSPARLELAMLVRDGRLTDIEDWLLRAMQLHPDCDDYYEAVRKALCDLDLARLEVLALPGAGRDRPR